MHETAFHKSYIHSMITHILMIERDLDLTTNDRARDLIFVIATVVVM